MERLDGGCRASSSAGLLPSRQGGRPLTSEKKSFNIVGEITASWAWVGGPKASGAEGSLPVCCVAWRWGDPRGGTLEVGPGGRKLRHWGRTLRGDVESHFPSLFHFLTVR